MKPSYLVLVLQRQPAAIALGCLLTCCLLVGCTGQPPVASNSDSSSTESNSRTANRVPRMTESDLDEDDGRERRPVKEEEDEDDSGANTTVESKAGEEVEKDDTPPRKANRNLEDDDEEYHSQPYRDLGLNRSGNGNAEDDEGSKGRGNDAIPSPASETGDTGTSPGDRIPEITGKDVDGVEFALSDYEGKVLMIDFWGDW